MNVNREKRAIDALLVSQLRSGDICIDQLPELTALEKEKIDSLGPDYVDRLLAGNVVPISPLPSAVVEEFVCGGAFGMNRADGIDDTTRNELDEQRQRIIERIKKLESEKNGDT